MATPAENQELYPESPKQRTAIRMPDDPRWFRRKYSRPPSKRLSVGFYWAASILLALFALIGSAHPFNFDFTLAISRFDGFYAPPNWQNIIANLGLFIPLGFVTGMQRTRSSQILGVILAALVAVFGQLIQVYVVSRTPAIWDLVSDLGGLLVGFALSRFVGHTKDRIDDRLSVASFLAIATLLTFQLAPFAPSLDITSIKTSIVSLGDSPVEHLAILLLGAAYVFITAGALKSELTPQKAAWVLWVAMAFVILLKPITAPNGLYVAMLTGILLAAIPASRLPADRRIFGLLAAVSLSLYIFDGLTPLQLRPQLVFPGISPLSILWTSDWITNLTTMTWKAFVLITAISLLFGAIEGDTITPMAIVVATTILVEGSQIFIASDTPSTIDIVLALGLCAAFSRSVRSNSRYFDRYGRNDRTRRGVRS